MQFLIVLIFVAIVHGKPALRVCPKEFDYSVGNSCFKYVNDQTLHHGEAETYCRQEMGGRLAILDSHLKMKITMEFFRSIFDSESENGGVPTAWIGGKWVKDTRHVRYDNGEINKHPHWMTVLKKHSDELFHFPTDLYGDDAVCLLASLWRKESPLSSRAGLYSGLYNMACEQFFFTHPLCEVTI